MGNIFSTKELELYIRNQFKKINNHNIININFSDGTQNNIEGHYAYSDGQYYHYLFTEKGHTNLHIITNDLFEISYRIYRDLIFPIALEYAAKEKKDNKDFRRILFRKTIELFAILGDKYKEKAEREIEDRLKEFPYKDKESSKEL